MAKPSVLLFRSASRNFPLDLEPDLRTAGYPITTVESLQQYIACPSRSHPQLVLFEIGTLVELDRAVTVVDWTERVQPLAPARYLLLLATKNLSVGDRALKLASAEIATLPQPARNLLFKLELQVRLLETAGKQPAVRAAEGFSAKLEEVPGSGRNRVLVVRGQNPRGGSWNDAGGGPSGKIRWRWVNAPGAAASAAAGFTWMAESAASPRFDEKLGGFVMEDEGADLICLHGAETLYSALGALTEQNGKPVPSRDNREEEKAEESNTSKTTSAGDQTPHANFESAANRSEAVKAAGAATERAQARPAPGAAHGTNSQSSGRPWGVGRGAENPPAEPQRRAVAPASEPSASELPRKTGEAQRTEAGPSELKNAAAQGTKSGTPVISPATREEPIAAGEAPTAHASGQNTPANSAKEWKVEGDKSSAPQPPLSTATATGTAIPSTMHQSEKSPEVAKKMRPAGDPAVAVAEPATSVSPLSASDRARAALEKADSALRAAAEGQARTKSTPEATATTEETRARETRPAAAAPGENPVPAARSGEPVSSSSAPVNRLHSAAAAPDSTPPTSAKATGSPGRSSDDSILIRDGGPGAKIPGSETSSAGNAKPFLNPISIPANSGSTPVSAPLSARTIPGGGGGPEEKRTVTGATPAEDDARRYLKNRHFEILSLAQLGDRDSSWHPTGKLRAYLAAKHRYFGLTQPRDALPLWIYDGELAPEFLDDTKAWKFYDRLPVEIRSLEGLPREVLEFLYQLAGQTAPADPVAPAKAGPAVVILKEEVPAQRVGAGRDPYRPEAAKAKATQPGAWGALLSALQKLFGRS